MAKYPDIDQTRMGIPESDRAMYKDLLKKK